MSNQTRVKELISRLETATEAVITVAKACSQSQWETIVPEEERSVGTLFHHLAYATPFVMGWVMTVASGEPLRTDITPEVADAFNENHAQEYATPLKEETLTLLTDTVHEAVAQLQKLTDEQLDITAPFIQPYRTAIPTLIEGKYTNAQLLVEWNLVHHRYEHLRQIKDTLGIG